MSATRQLLRKAKYTRRWKGKDGRWRYEYPDESSHTPRQRQAPPHAERPQFGQQLVVKRTQKKPVSPPEGQLDMFADPPVVDPQPDQPAREPTARKRRGMATVQLPHGTTLKVTDADLKAFEKKIRSRLSARNHRDFEIENNQRGYVLYWQADPDHFASDPDRVVDVATAAVLDGVDHIAAVEPDPNRALPKLMSVTRQRQHLTKLMDNALDLDRNTFIAEYVRLKTATKEGLDRYNYQVTKGDQPGTYTIRYHTPTASVATMQNRDATETVTWFTRLPLTLWESDASEWYGLKAKEAGLW